MERPKLLIDEEVLAEPRHMIVSNTNIRGVIWGINKHFSDISGYSAKELKGVNHNILRHPDMPKIIFKLMWDRITNGHNILAFVKNVRKDGRYYWVITDFEVMFKRNDPTEIYKFYAYRKAAPRHSLDEIIELYASLLKEEKKSGEKASEEYLNTYLARKKMSYDEYMQSLIKQKKKGLFGRVAKSLFG